MGVASIEAAISSIRYKSKDKIMPGICIDQAVLPMQGARLIAGRSGCWVGKVQRDWVSGGRCTRDLGSRYMVRCWAPEITSPPPCHRGHTDGTMPKRLPWSV